MTLKGRNKNFRNEFYDSWIKHIYTIYCYVLLCNSCVRPGQRRQHLISVTKEIIQLVFRKGKKKLPLDLTTHAHPTDLRASREAAIKCLIVFNNLASL